jgi:two-component sensor histidine kinase/CHASE1-domain containing sensor protein
MILRTYFPAAVVLSMALFGTVISADLLRGQLNEVERHYFHDLAAGIDAAIRSKIAAYEQVLRAGTALFNAPAMTPSEGWRDFAAALIHSESLPGLKEIGYVRLPRGAGVSFQAMLDCGLSADRLESIYLLPARARCLQEALWQKTHVAMPDPVSVAHGQAAAGAQLAWLFLVPVYDGVAVPQTIEERHARLFGFVYGLFHAREFFMDPIPERKPDWSRLLRLEILENDRFAGKTLVFDSQTVQSASIFEGEGAPRLPKFSETFLLTVGGSQWTLLISQQPGTGSHAGQEAPLGVLIGGSFISVLLAVIVACLSRANRRAAEARLLLCAEIAEKECAQRRIELINRELIHRVKNTLAIVTAFISQTGLQSTSVGEFSRVLRERVVSLARVHDLLRHSPAWAADFRALVQHVLEPYCAGGQSSLSIEGPSVEVPANEAVLLSLLINELATNATKHGAWSAPGGNVQIEWSIAMEEKSEAVTVFWRERGVASTKEAELGFGTNLMKFSIERGLRGSISSSFGVDGVSYVIRYPRRKYSKEQAPASSPLV